MRCSTGPNSNQRPDGSGSQGSFGAQRAGTIDEVSGTFPIPAVKFIRVTEVVILFIISMLTKIAAPPPKQGKGELKAGARPENASNGCRPA